MSLAGARADGIAEWDKLRWGMTHQQAAVAYPNFEAWDTTEPNDFGPPGLMVIHNLGLREHQILQCRFSISLFFRDNQLNQIQVHQIEGDPTDCSEPMKSALVQKYGQPRPEDQSPPSGLAWSQDIFWKTGRTTVYFNAIYVAPYIGERARWWSKVIYTYNDAPVASPKNPF
jgi:hypothetical protein